jgi:5-carboxymethyl-2-hydroxymuconate isomerase
MPHAILEYTQNVVDDVDPHDLFRRLHEIMTSAGPFTLSDIKSRVYACEHFHIADGNPHNAFVHLSLSVLEGRDPEVLRMVGEHALDLLREAYAQSHASLNCQFSVEIREMARPLYFKIGSGQ